MSDNRTKEEPLLSRKEVRKIVGWHRLLLPFMGFKRFMSKKSEAMNPHDFRILRCSIYKNDSLMIIEQKHTNITFLVSLIAIVPVFLLSICVDMPLFTIIYLGFVWSFMPIHVISFLRQLGYNSNVFANGIDNKNFINSSHPDIKKIGQMSLVEFLEFNDNLIAAGYTDKDILQLHSVMKETITSSDYTVSELNENGKAVLERALQFLPEQNIDVDIDVLPKRIKRTDTNLFSSLLHVGVQLENSTAS